MYVISILMLLYRRQIDRQWPHVCPHWGDWTSYCGGGHLAASVHWHPSARRPGASHHSPMQALPALTWTSFAASFGVDPLPAIDSNGRRSAECDRLLGWLLQANWNNAFYRRRAHVGAARYRHRIFAADWLVGPTR